METFGEEILELKFFDDHDEYKVKSLFESIVISIDELKGISKNIVDYAGEQEE